MRLLFYGIRYIVETHVTRQWTEKDVDQAELFYRQVGDNAVMIPGCWAGPLQHAIPPPRGLRLCPSISRLNTKCCIAETNFFMFLKA